MKKFLLATTIVIIMCFGAGPAKAMSFLNDFYFDLDGAGGLAPVQIDEYFDVVGGSLIINTFQNATSGTFVDFGVISSLQHDSGPLFPWAGAAELTGIFEATGTFTLGDSFQFTGGYLNMYRDDATGLVFSDDTDNNDGIIYGANDGDLIASWKVNGGSGVINPDGIPNGEITISFEADFLMAGIFFDENMNDLKDLPLNYVLGWSTTNGSYINNPSDALTQELSEFAGISPEAINDLPNVIYAGANGQYRLAIVPEPATMLLLGLGLIGLAGVSRKKKVA